MEIFRTQRPEILKYIAPHIIEAPDYDRLTILDNILSSMLERSEDTCVVVALDGDKLIAFSIAIIVRKHLWIDQTWIDSEQTKEVGLGLLYILKDFALEKDIHDMRFETSRNAEAWERSWGFEEFSSIMRMEL